MARYRVLEKSFIDGLIREPGDIVEYAGEAGDNLQKVDGNTPVTVPGEDDDKKVTVDPRSLPKRAAK